MSTFEDYTPQQDEIRTEKPDIFNEASLNWVAYAETRRTDGGMTGNLSDRNSSINPEGYTLSRSPLSYDQWMEKEVADVHTRHQMLLSRLSLSDIAYPYPTHGTNLLSITAPVESTSISLQAEERAQADAALVQTEGLASAITPADCPILNFVDTLNKRTLQIHAGYVGLESGVVRKVLNEISTASRNNYLVYVSPFARNGFDIHGQVLERLSANPLTKDFILPREDGHVFDLGNAVRQQLTDAGIHEYHVELSRDDTLTQDEFFSHRNRAQKGAAGRNGIILGIHRDS